MNEEVVYHLDECSSCAQRQSCKYINEIDLILKDLPLDLRGASCNEYNPEDTVDENWKEYAEEDTDDDEYEDEPIDLSEVNSSELVAMLTDAILDVMESKQGTISMVYMNQATMDALKPAFNTDKNLVAIIMTDETKIDLSIDEDVDTGFFEVEILY